MKQLHKQWRSNFRKRVFTRDREQCRVCGMTGELDAHHITDRHKMPNGGYVESNGITLCSTHHLKAESFHINDGKSWDDGFHPNDLYKMISSSYEKAYQDSLILSN